MTLLYLVLITYILSHYELVNETSPRYIDAYLLASDCFIIHIL